LLCGLIQYIIFILYLKWLNNYILLYGEERKVRVRCCVCEGKYYFGNKRKVDMMNEPTARSSNIFYVM